jgi:hypothetical protein
MGRLIDADLLKQCYTGKNSLGTNENDSKADYVSIRKMIDNQPTACDTENELRLLKNYLHNKSKAYRQRNANYVIVRDLLMANTSHAGMTSCIMKCYELGINPYGYNLEGAVKDE